MIAFAHTHCPLRRHLLPERHGWYAMVLDGAGEIVAEGWDHEDPWRAGLLAIMRARAAREVRA